MCMKIECTYARTMKPKNNQFNLNTDMQNKMLPKCQREKLKNWYAIQVENSSLGLTWSTSVSLKRHNWLVWSRAQIDMQSIGSMNQLINTPSGWGRFCVIGSRPQRIILELMHVNWQRYNIGKINFSPICTKLETEISWCTCTKTQGPTASFFRHLIGLMVAELRCQWASP